MGTSKMQEATRPQLNRIIYAWCTIVEHLATPISEYEIERQLTGGSSFLGNSDFRQWARWKKGQLPSGVQFKELNEIAVQLGWMPSLLGQVLLEAFVARSGVELTDSIQYGWDLLAALTQCTNFAEENQLSMLMQHCSHWRLELVGPEYNGDIAPANEIIEDNNYLIYEIINKGIRDNLELDISQLIWKSYKLGFDDPFPLILTIIREHRQNWLNTKEIYDNDKFEKD